MLNAVNVDNAIKHHNSARFNLSQEVPLIESGARIKCQSNLTLKKKKKNTRARDLGLLELLLFDNCAEGLENIESCYLQKKRYVTTNEKICSWKHIFFLQISTIQQQQTKDFAYQFQVAY